MIAANATLKALALVLGAIAALLALWFLFELRYIWYVDAPEAGMLRLGFGICAISIVGLWLAFPSRIAVGALGIAAALFPVVLDARRPMPNVGFIIVLLIVVGSLVALTHLRRGLTSKYS